MNQETKWIFAAIVALTLLIAPAVSCWARPTWKDGAVTQVMANEQPPAIEIDGIRHTFMPKAMILQRQTNSTGGYDEDIIPLWRVFNGQKVEAMIEGFRVYQLVVVR